MIKATIFWLILSGFIYAQTGLFNEPRISGTPLIPPKEKIKEYTQSLKKQNYSHYNTLLYTPLKEYGLGSERSFNVLNLTDKNNIKIDSKLFVLKKVSSQVNIWVEKNELQNGHISESTIQTIFNGLLINTPPASINPSKGIYDIDVEVFGTPPDYDNNGRVDFLLTDIKDGWNGAGGFIGGFFTQLDQSNDVGSNRADILYIDTYPGIYNPNNSSVNTQNALGTVAHELQHLLQYNQDPLEQNFINEGLSELASYLCGYGLRSPDLYLQSSETSLLSWDNKDALKHYSKVALWHYYLYEKFGLPIVKNIARNKSQGVVGVNNALIQSGISSTFNEIALRFFKTISINDPALNNEYYFTWESLRYFRAIPSNHIEAYPKTVNYAVKPYSFQTISCTNGDSLQLNFANSAGLQIFANRLGFGTDSYLVKQNENNQTFYEFGKSFHTHQVVLFNNSNTLLSTKIDFNATQKYSFTTHKYDSDNISFYIGMANQIGAVKFFSQQDNALLKSIDVYKNVNSDSPVIHLYKNNINAGSSTPQSDNIVIKNVGLSKWNKIDVEDLNRRYSKGSAIDVGIEFKSDGALGYQDLSGSAHLGKSFLASSTTNVFNQLNKYKVAGKTLSGTWMLRVVMAYPFSGNSEENEQEIKSVQIYPNPISAASNKKITIRYETDGDGEISVQIYNSLGQLVKTLKQNASVQQFDWDLTNNEEKSCSRGLYFIQIGNKKSIISKKVLIL